MSSFLGPDELPRAYAPATLALIAAAADRRVGQRPVLDWYLDGALVLHDRYLAATDVELRHFADDHVGGDILHSAVAILRDGSASLAQQLVANQSAWRSWSEMSHIPRHITVTPEAGQAFTDDDEDEDIQFIALSRAISQIARRSLSAIAFEATVISMRWAIEVTAPSILRTHLAVYPADIGATGN